MKPGGNMPQIKVGDISMYYEVHGKGEPLVIICGASATTEVYAMLLPYYFRHYQVILFDNRGAGRTDAPDIPYTIAMMADDMAGLLAAIDIRRAHVYGQSMGGMIAQEFAWRYPKQVKNLVLQCTTCGGPHAIGLKESRRFNRAIRMKMTPQELGRETLQLCVTQGYIDSHPDVAKIMMQAMMKQSEPVHGALRQSEAARCFDIFDRLPAIKAPTLVLGGESDQAVAVENSRIIAARIPGAELVLFPGAGHILIEAGNEPNRIILEFLGQHYAR
jgi:pimeloyl-ACP methyl ester carboxylesterase